MTHHGRSPSSSRRCTGSSARIVLVLLLSVAGPWPGAMADDGTERGFFGLIPVSTNRGLAVKSVTEGGPAQRAGIAPGDLLLTLSGRPVANLPQDEIHEVFTSFRVGEVVEVVYRRPDEEIVLARLELVPVPGPTLEQQRRIEEIEREIRASEVVKRIMAASDEIELERSGSGTLRYRPDDETPWETLHPDVSEQLEPLMEHRREGELRVRYRIERGDDGEIERLVRIDRPEK